MGEGIIGKIGLVGFDGNPVFDFFDAPISYIQQPIDVLVQKALEILIDIIISWMSLNTPVSAPVEAICFSFPYDPCPPVQAEEKYYPPEKTYPAD